MDTMQIFEFLFNK